MAMGTSLLWSYAYLWPSQLRVQVTFATPQLQLDRLEHLVLLQPARHVEQGRALLLSSIMSSPQVIGGVEGSLVLPHSKGHAKHRTDWQLLLVPNEHLAGLPQAPHHHPPTTPSSLISGKRSWNSWQSPRVRLSDWFGFSRTWLSQNIRLKLTFHTAITGGRKRRDVFTQVSMNAHTYFWTLTHTYAIWLPGNS